MRKDRIRRKTACGLLFFTLFLFFLGEGIPGTKSGGSVILAQGKEAQKETFFVLTQEEEDYLAGLRAEPLFVGISGFGAWEFQDGMDCGPVAPLVDVLHHEFGLELRLVQGSWEENRAAMQDGALDILVGVPAAYGEKAEDGESPVLPESGLYCSAWLYENPYVIVEYTKKASAEEDTASQSGAVLAYIAGDPACEELIAYLLETPGMYLEGANAADDVELFSCADEQEVFAALQGGQAAAGLLPEEALFLSYPALDFVVTARPGMGSGRAAAGAENPKLLPLLAILNRYLETTEEGEALRAAMRVQQQGIRAGKIREQEQATLQNLQARAEDLQYAQAGLDAVPFFWHEGDRAYGELADFLTFVAGCTGLVLKECPLSGEEALQALEDGDILFAAGMPFAGSGQAYCYVGMYTDSLIPVIPQEDAGQFRQEMIAERYWGVVQEWMPLLSGTVFDGHVVGFSDEKALYEAMGAKEIGGMLMMEGSLDALVLSGEEAYAVLDGIAFSVRNGLAFSDAHSDAAEFFGRMWQFYSLFHREVPDAAGQYRAAYAQVKGEHRKLTRLVWILGSASLVFAAAFLMAVRGRKKQPKKTKK